MEGVGKLLGGGVFGSGFSGSWVDGRCRANKVATLLYALYPPTIVNYWTLGIPGIGLLSRKVVFPASP